MISKDPNKVWMSYVEAMIFLKKEEKRFEDLLDEDLDVMYFHVFQRKAYHMSREGFINSLTTERNRINA